MSKTTVAELRELRKLAGVDPDAPMPQEYVPVDHSLDARMSWPSSDYANSFPELNARELGQRLTGELSGRSLHGERAHLLTLDENRMAGVVIALVENGWSVGKHSWDAAGTPVTLAVWTGL